MNIDELLLAIVCDKYTNPVLILDIKALMEKIYSTTLTVDSCHPSQSMRLQQSPDSLSPDSTIDTSSKRDKESYPTQLYRHIKVHTTKS